ncbi:MAG TPA: hypothetical protein VGC41_23475, partial [Kofleriaceae bacterium]
LLLGKVAAGGACMAAYECATGFCEDTGDRAGTCVDVSKPGAVCGRECSNDLYCEAGTCHEHIADGQACTTDFQCESGSCDGETCLPATPHCDGNGT